ncbi:MAG: phosphomethylpyrimidine synthase ThiC, partial [Candidatus Omnitrophica bacterium]|nr:phosphomethylpyrimidine synthase ThiC [Candidatus Omnitrophota bacterium]
MTQIEYARKNILTSIMKKISSQESLSGEVFLKRLKEGKIVIPLNHKHKIKKPCAVGLGLKTKINANIGTSPDKDSSSDELEKLAVALKYGADTVMDLSVGSDIPGVRRRILKASCVPVGTVPIYEIAVNAQKKYKDLLRFDINSILDCLETQASDGVDFFTI